MSARSDTATGGTAPIRVRLAPSPTGPLHVGTARTALFNVLFARQHGGAFVVRIEDTDRERSRPEFEAEILEGLAWLGLTWDEGPDVGGPHGPYRQSERSARYTEAITTLLDAGRAVEHAGAIVFRTNVTEPMTVHDLIRGNVEFPPEQRRDFLIAKPASGREEQRWEPLFHLAVVVDDAAMGITHVIRGEDHLSNTPKHILIQHALGVPTPAYAHIPLLLDEQRHKLSKRTATTGLRDFRAKGYLPEALVNFLALLGWNPKTADEIFSLDELIARFDLCGVQKSGAIFAINKLDWLQREHLRRLSGKQLAQRARAFLEADLPDAVRPEHTQRLERALDVWKARGGTLSELPTTLKFYFEPPEPAPEDLVWKDATLAEARAGLEFIDQAIAESPKDLWESGEALQQALLNAVDAAQRDRGTTLWAARVALSGIRESASAGEIAWVLGEGETHERLQRAIKCLP